ncbi:MAG: transcriptional regulator [Candidatus Thermoplasmatota archaeon]|nr:transcriptional regulator [Candidatus Thermoplasmatota archaeon]
MNRLQLIEKVRDILSKGGFYLSQRQYQPGMLFDIIARKDDKLFVIRATINADSSRINNAKELKVLCDAIDASPLYISLIGGQKRLKQGVVYSRKNIPLMCPDTLEDMILEGVPPCVFSAPGGFYVKMDSDILKKARKEKKISLSKLAEIGGVSRKSIQKYEDGMGAELEVALKLEEFLGEDLILPINPFEKGEPEEECPASLDQYSKLERTIFESLKSLGYKIVPTCKCPFEAITEDDDTVILSGVGPEDNKDLKEKAKIVSNLSDITEKDSAIFLQKRYTHRSIKGIPIIEKDELSKIDDREKVSELLADRK